MLQIKKINPKQSLNETAETKRIKRLVYPNRWKELEQVKTVRESNKSQKILFRFESHFFIFDFKFYLLLFDLELVPLQMLFFEHFGCLEFWEIALTEKQLKI